MTTESPQTPPPDTAAADNGLRWMLKWVFVVLVLTVLFAMVMVGLTIRWLS